MSYIGRRQCNPLPVVDLPWMEFLPKQRVHILVISRLHHFMPSWSLWESKELWQLGCFGLTHLPMPGMACGSELSHQRVLAE